MHISAALAADLSALTVALDEPGVDLEQTLRRLTDNAQVAVPSFLGLSVEMTSDNRTVTIAATDGAPEPAPIASSLGIGLPDGDARIMLVLYAATPGAFVDLAADLSWLVAGAGADFVLDADLGAMTTASGRNQLRDLSVTNQAIGLLIGQGRTPDEAADHLTAVAAETGVDRADVAARILADGS